MKALWSCRLRAINASHPDTTFNLPTRLFCKRDGAFAVKRSRSQRIEQGYSLWSMKWGPFTKTPSPGHFGRSSHARDTAWGPQYHAQGAEIWTHTFNPGSAYKVVVQKYSCRCFFANRGAVYHGVSFVQERQALPQLISVPFTPLASATWPPDVWNCLGAEGHESLRLRKGPASAESRHNMGLYIM